MNDTKHDLYKQTSTPSPFFCLFVFLSVNNIGHIPTVPKASTRCQAYFLDWAILFLFW